LHDKSKIVQILGWLHFYVPKDNGLQW